MKLTASEYISKAEDLKSSEMSARQKIESVQSKRGSIKSAIETEQYRLESAYAKLEALQNSDSEGDEDSEGSDNSSEIASIMAEISDAQEAIGELQSEDADLLAEQAIAEGELRSIESEEQAALSEIEDSATRTSQNIALISSFGGDYANVSSRAASSFQQNLGQLSQAAQILGGSINTSAGGGGGSARAGYVKGSQNQSLSSGSAASRNLYEAAAQQRESGSAGKSAFGGSKSSQLAGKTNAASSFDESTDDGSSMGKGKKGGLGSRLTSAENGLSDEDSLKNKPNEFKSSIAYKVSPTPSPRKQTIQDVISKYGKENVIQRIRKAGARQLERFAVKTGLAEKCDFGNLDDRVCQAVVEVAMDMKVKLPNLNLAYLGSSQAQINSARESGQMEAVRKAYEQYFFHREKMNHPERDIETQQFIVKQYVDEQMRKLFTISDNTYARSMSVKGRDKHLKIAETIMSGITVNEFFGANFDYMSQKIKANVKERFHPEGCDSVKAVIYHEFGHQVAKYLDAEHDSVIQQLHQQFCHLSADERSSALSAYASRNIQEFLAECWSEGCCNPNCRPTAAKVYNRMIALLGEQRIKERSLPEGR